MATQTHTLQNQSNQQPVAQTQRDFFVQVMLWLPRLLLVIAAGLLITSISQPYWGMELKAPQYPNGLKIRLFVDHLSGNPDTRLDEVREIDGLNHYIGMGSMYTAAPIERAIAVPSIVIMAVLLVVVALVRRRWITLLAVPALSFPVVFLGDLAFWLHYYGQNLDPTAPFSSSIKPFTPSIIGASTIGQFDTFAYVDVGWYLATGACVLTLVALGMRMFIGKRLARSK